MANLADRLAHAMNATSLNGIGATVQALELVILTDGSDVQWLRSRIQDVHRRRTQVIGVGLEANALSWAFPEFQCIAVPDENPSALWRAVVSAVDEVPAARPPVQRPKVFVSHAVADEGQLFPILETLRSVYGLELFVCADSIPPGSEWQQTIRTKLVQCDLFLLVSSASVLESTYCAFEVGMATALDKAIRVVHIDQSSSPSYVSHMQGISIPRRLVRTPWLSMDEALLDGILEALAMPVDDGLIEDEQVRKEGPISDE